jgi:predicted ABC-type ATPase
LITVLAGVNGAGKSSIGGSALRNQGQDWYNPDAVARVLHEQFPSRPLAEINGQVWQEGLVRLRQAINDNTNFTFETTLGGDSITGALLDAVAAGVRVSVWCCGLESVELHIERVAARVQRGGHDIPEPLIRERYTRSMRNLCRLAHGLHQLAVFDNSRPLDPKGRPQVRQLIQVRRRELLYCEKRMPAWAKPVAAVCLNHFRFNAR